MTMNMYRFVQLKTKTRWGWTRSDWLQLLPGMKNKQYCPRGRNGDVNYVLLNIFGNLTLLLAAVWSESGLPNQHGHTCWRGRAARFGPTFQTEHKISAGFP